ncbi:putative fluoride ion transporter CrcB [Cellulomonas hominis]|uniref:Fluoride-specific ion channel FluC n=1 Tax=Cellulomonas hominis TaxID=156981 RepID=A0A511FHU4_9CELL|nr:CrcB family protein [Cellulomonas hominis]MBB5475108.1 CrcB protein [Cellulomonas hominis]NKY06761.1 CrcB family protein [Cellulomonas hominis]GEL48819.1 putative fluoride ion transporter CrcB [Cellulomonas hominis]
MTALWLALAGGLGAAARFLLDTVIARHNRLSTPIGTIVVNVTACMLLGLLTGWAVGDPARGDLKTILGVGFLGGYSTFSTASVEGARLVVQGRRWTALGHAGSMLVLSILGSSLGLYLGGIAQQSW